MTPVTRRAAEERSGRLALAAGLGAALTGAVFASLHRSLLLDAPAIAVDGPAPALAYFLAGTAFQFGVPVLCLVALFAGRFALTRWTARIGLICAAAAFTGYLLYVRTCLEMAR